MAKRLILIDGPEGDHGQRTLRHALEDALASYSYVNMAPHGERIHAYQYFEAIKPALIDKQDVVLEHSWYGANSFEGAEYQMLERAALSCGAVHIVCRPGMFRGPPEDLVRPDQLIADDVSVVTFDNSSMLCQDPQRFVRQFVYPAMDYAPCAPTPYCGKWVPRAIALISDKPKFKGFQVPYISFRQDGVSWWLADAMDRANLDEKHFVWANCQDADGVETDPEPLIRLKPTICLAMGENAAAWCKRHGLVYAEHKMPLSWKNQHKGQMYPLIKDCKKLISAMK